MHDPLSLIKDFRLFSIWHKDPCRDGSDDSCGRFMRSRHGDPEVLERIVKRFSYDWDGTFTSEGSGTTYFTGYFCPDGDPHLSVHAIVLNLFHAAAFEVMGSKKSWAFMRKHIFDILMFAENPCDSLHDSITRKYQLGCQEPYTKKVREERIRSLAHSIYGWILRETRPWWKNPDFHIHHWRINFPLWHRLRRWLKHRCIACGKRIGFKGSPVCHSWDGDGPYTCAKCSEGQCAATQPKS